MANSVTKAQLSAEDRQFNKNKWLFSVSGIGRDMSYQLITSFLLTYIQFGMTLSISQFLVISLIIGVAGRIWDAINDPLMGAIIEGSHMKMGKFRPWILIGAILTAVIIILMFNIQSLSGWGFVVFMAIMYLLWESAYTMNDIGYWSMLASLSSKKEQRNSVTMLTVVFAGVGAFIAQGVIGMLFPGNVLNAFRWISIAVAVIFITMQVIMVAFVKERPRSQLEQEEKVSVKQMWQTIKKNDQVLWMTLSMLFYTIGSGLLVGLAYNLYYLEIGFNGNAIVFIAIFGVFNILSQMFYPYLSKKLGRKKLQFWSTMMACFGYLGIALLGWVDFLPFNLVTLSIFGVFVFVGQALYYLASIINMTNCVEYNDYKHGERNEAVVSTLRPFMAKFGDAMKYGIVTVVLIVSAVYGLSQNIGTMEGQKGHFDRMESGSEQALYIEQINECFDQYLVKIEDGVADVDKINEEINSYSALTGKQIDATYLAPLADVYIVCYDDNDVVVKSFVMGEATEQDCEFVANHDGKCVMLNSNSKSEVGPVFSAADKHFKDKGTTNMRLWIRMAVTMLPAALLLLSLFIQNKKFIIDEKYYDMMLEEIEKRKQENPTEQTE